MSSKNFAAYALHAEQDVVKDVVNLFGSALSVQKGANEKQIIKGLAKDFIRLTCRWDEQEDFKVCCFSRVFFRIKSISSTIEFSENKISLC
jgi:hypothetical protein